MWVRLPPRAPGGFQALTVLETLKSSRARRPRPYLPPAAQPTATTGTRTATRNHPGQVRLPPRAPGGFQALTVLETLKSSRARRPRPYLPPAAQPTATTGTRTATRNHPGQVRLPPRAPEGLQALTVLETLKSSRARRPRPYLPPAAQPTATTGTRTATRNHPGQVRLPPRAPEGFVLSTSPYGGGCAPRSQSRCNRRRSADCRCGLCPVCRSPGRGCCC